MTGSVGPVESLEYLVLSQDLATGALSLAGGTGYRPEEREAAHQAARDAAAVAQAQDRTAAPTLHAVVRICEVHITEHGAQQWLWISEISSGGRSWSPETSAGTLVAGIQEGPQQAEAAADFFLRERLHQLARDADDLDIEDDWWRISVWNADRTDESSHPVEGGRIADRAAVLGTPDKLGWFAGILSNERVHADATATATPRQVNRIMRQA